MLSRSTSWKRCSPDLPVHYYASLDNLLDFKDDFYSLHCLFVVVGKFLSFGNNFIFNAACQDFFWKIFFIELAGGKIHRWNLEAIQRKLIFFASIFFPSPKSLPTSGDDEIFFPCQWTFFLFWVALRFLQECLHSNLEIVCSPPRRGWGVMEILRWKWI